MAQSPWKAGGSAVDAALTAGGAEAFASLCRCGDLIASYGAVSCAPVWVRVLVWVVARVGEGGRATAQAPRRTGGCAVDAARVLGGDVASASWRWRGGSIVSVGVVSCATVWVCVSVWAVA